MFDDSFKRFTMKEILKKSEEKSKINRGSYCKGDLADDMGLHKIDGSFDTALPVDILRNILDSENCPEYITRDKLLLTTFVVYERKKGCHGRLVSGCIEVQVAIDCIGFYIV